MESTYSLSSSNSEARSPTGPYATWSVPALMRTPRFTAWRVTSMPKAAAART